MTARLRVSILVVGDEILGGFVADTNSGWLAQRLRTVGVPLDRVVTVPDDLSAIDEALQTELARARPRVLLTSGGIGSTPDDVTLEAVAASLGRGMEVHPHLDERITATLERTAAAGAAVSAEHAQSLRTMARVPVGAYLLRPGDADPATATAPAVAVDIDGGATADGGATVVILPGVPSLFQRITVDSVEPALLAGRGRPEHVAEHTHGYPESALTPVLRRLTAEFPDVHVGSYPGRRCLVRLRGPQARVEAAEAILVAALEQLGAEPASAQLQALWQSRWRD